MSRPQPISQADILEIARRRGGNFYTRCPECGPYRKPIHQHIKTLSCLVTDGPDEDGNPSRERVILNCHHCGHTGVLFMSEAPSPQPKYREPKPKKFPPAKRNPEDLYPAHLEWLESRGISQELALSAGIYSTYREWDGDWVAFPYIDTDDKTVRAIKLRAVAQKEFKAESGGDWAIPYGMWQKFDTKEPLVITEGEIDCLSLMQAGIKNVISVPCGAPSAIDQGPGRFRWMEKCEALLRRFKRYTICVDSDSAGGSLREELIRRLGRARCSEVRFPEDCKDPNEVLLKHSKLALIAAISKAEPVPLIGVYDAGHYWKDMLTNWYDDLKPGVSTGMAAIDPLYTVAPGFMTIVTGVPGNGKSQWLDNVMAHLAMEHDWVFGVCSFEKNQRQHIRRLLQITKGRPIDSRYQDAMGPMDITNSDAEWMSAHFTWQDFSGSGHDSPTLNAILERAECMLLRYGINGLVIDPYSYVQRTGDKEERETEFVQAMLAKLQGFAKSNNIHVWIVAHPYKMRQERGPSIPGGYDISGSAAWFNSTDMGVTVHRNEDGTSKIWVWKCREAAHGQCGYVDVSFDVRSGRYGVYTQPPAPQCDDDDGYYGSSRLI